MNVFLHTSNIISEYLLHLKCEQSGINCFKLKLKQNKIIFSFNVTFILHDRGIQVNK